MATTEELVSLFHRDGFLVIPNALDASQIEKLKADVEKLKNDAIRTFSRGRNVLVHHRMFEVSDPHFHLFFNEPIASLAETIVKDGVIQKVGGQQYNEDFTGQDSTLECHVIHNNALVVPPGKVGIERWHQDDPPHYIVKSGKPPRNVHLPVLALTANYYLTDVLSLTNGPTAFIPGSHLFGRPCPSKIDESLYNVHHALGKAGTVVLFNCQVWHRGTPNTSDVARYVSQVTYGRRFIGHKHWPFMDYVFPERLTKLVENDARKKRLTGFLSHGPYG